jgi:hypothetical protein
MRPARPPPATLASISSLPELYASPSGAKGEERGGEVAITGALLVVVVVVVVVVVDLAAVASSGTRPAWTEM